VEEAMRNREEAVELEGREADLAEYFDRCAAEGDLLEFDFDERRRLDEFLPMWAIQPGERVLEPGCGSGRLTVELARPRPGCCGGACSRSRPTTGSSTR
jgi:ubiquinone/menaquinone biosynthesis C-methylase UbiE